MRHANNLTIFIPTYENDELLCACIESIRRFMGCSTPSIVVLDDSETDKVKVTMADCKADKNVRVTYYPRSRKSEASHVENWNKMFDIIEKTPSIGWFQLRHHDDQLISINSRDILFETLATPNSDLIISPVVKRVMRVGCAEIKRYHCHPLILKMMTKLNPDILYYFNYIGPTASMWIRKNSDISRIRFNSSLTWLVDCNWYSRILMAAGENKVKITSDLLTVSVPNSSSITACLSTRNMNGLIEEELSIVMPKSSKHYRLILLASANGLKILNWVAVLLNPLIEIRYRDY